MAVLLGSNPVDIYLGSTAISSVYVGSSPAGGNWLESAEFADYAIVLDFENNRYALPALDGNSDPILTRVEGKFPKREVTFSEAMKVNRYAIQPEDYPADYLNTLWYTYQNGSWGLIGGDGLGIDTPRMERWLGKNGMWVDPAMRFNRTPYSTTTTYPVSIALARGFSPGYRVSWVGNDDLVYYVVGHEEETPWSGTIAARSTNADGLNWGVIPQVTEGYNNEDTVITRANKSGATFFHYLQIDTWTNAYYPATSMVQTDTATYLDGSFRPTAHTERSPEHVRLSNEAAAIFARGDGYPRAGTFILETHQTMEPTTNDRRIVLAGHDTPGPYYGIALFSFTLEDGVYKFTHNSFGGDMKIDLPNAAATTSNVRMALAVNGENTLRRLGITGVGTVLEAGSHPSNFVIPHFGTGTPDGYVATQDAGGASGTGAYYKFMWSPDVFTETKILEEVSL